MALRPDELIAELEGVAMKTSQGTFVRIEDVRRLMEKHEAEAEPMLEPPPRNMDEARGQAQRWLEEQNGPRPPELGRALPATEPQPPSRA